MKTLKKNDTVAIVAPAGFLKETESTNKAILLLESWGLQVKLSKHLFIKHHHFAGTDQQRIEDFQKLLDDKHIKVIWCARGGYGSVRIIDKLDFTNFKKHPKWIVGYSDITVFHQAVFNLGFETLHSFMPTSLNTITKDKQAIANFKKVLFNEELSYKTPYNSHNKIGKTKGKMIGGNLAIISSLLGTDYTIKGNDFILFIEEIGEYKYNIDRMLHSLKLNNLFKNCIGLIVGSFTNIKKNNPNFGQAIEEIILNVVSEYDFPVCFDFPAGHITNNNPIIFGRKAVLDITNKNTLLSFLPKS